MVEGPKKRVLTSHVSDRTIRRHKRVKRLMEAQGFLSLPDFFKHKAEREWQGRSPEEPEIVVTGTAGPVLEDKSSASLVSTAAPAMGAKVPAASVAQEALGKLVAFTAAATASEALSHMSMASTVGGKDRKEEEEDDDDEVAFITAAVAASSAAIEARKEEEEDEVVVVSTTGNATPPHSPSSSESGNVRQPSWGRSRTILYEHEPEESSSSGSDTESGPEDLQGTDTHKLKGHHHRKSHDDPSPQQPMCKGVHSLMPDLGRLWSTADLLQLRPGFLQRCSFNEMRR